MHKDTDPFIDKLEAHIESNLDNEQFGVEQLAELMNMSRSHLHRKLQKAKGKSISRFIREYRLEKARQLLVEQDINASEASHSVGFSSASYFNKCFTEHFGYSPGKARERMVAIGQIELVKTTSSDSGSNKKWWWAAVALLGIISLGFWWSTNKNDVVETSSVTSSEKKSIIVLPFKNLSSNEENQYLADGMVDAIGRNLSGIESFNVVNSAASGPLTSIREIGETLNVSTVLQGSIQRQDSVVRIEVKLFDTSSESQIWADHYDRKLTDILAINVDIAQQIAMALQTTLTSKEEAIIEKRSSYDPIAYDYYMQGEYHFSQLNPEGQVEALKFYEKAMAIDSTLALAYNGIAGTYLWKASSFGSELEPEKAIEKAKYYIEKARYYDPNIWEINCQEAYMSLYIDWDFEKAEELFLSCIDKSTAIYQVIYVNFLMYEHRYQEALKYYTAFTKRFPYFPNSAIPWLSYYSGNYEKGNEFIESRANSGAISLFNLGAFGFFYLNYGEYDKAIKWLEKEEKIYGVRLPRTVSLLGAAYAKKGNIQKANSLLNELKEIKSKTDARSSAWGIGIIHSALGEKEEALKWLQIAIDEHESDVAWLVSEPQLYPLHGHPKFDALVKQVGFREHAYPVELPEKLY